jgi:hypothetical protein
MEFNAELPVTSSHSSTTDHEIHQISIQILSEFPAMDAQLQAFTALVEQTKKDIEFNNNPKLNSFTTNKHSYQHASMSKDTGSRWTRYSERWRGL